jgi:hypothetical protein
MIGGELPHAPFVEAEWKRPSLQLLATYIENLPDILRQSQIQAQKLWDTGNHRKMIDGCRVVTDVLEQSWGHLSAWCSPRHFQGRPAEYFSNYIANRYSWNYALEEPEANGSRGQEAHLMYVTATMNDVKNAVKETALSLGRKFVDGFDEEGWKARWNGADTAP